MARLGQQAPPRKCRLSLVTFLRTYFPAAFPLPFSPDHLRVIGSLEHILQHGGLKAIACPRGFGKTSITARAVLWSLLYGHRKFAMLVGATDTSARNLLATLKSELCFNELLAMDFPEVCFPIRCLKNNARLCTGQLWAGKQTLITWSSR